MSYEGENLKTLNTNTIPSKICEKARNDFDLIHEIGVYLTDMKKSNVCWNIGRQQIVFIDFGAVYLRDEQRGPSCGDVFSDVAESIDSILNIPISA
jgi:tRNA A-37 threonylcarbamoyl transferase component Bud32